MKRPPIPDELRRALKLARVAQGRTQLEIANAAGLSRVRLSMIETANVAPRPDELERLKAALGLGDCERRR